MGYLIGSVVVATFVIGSYFLPAIIANGRGREDQFGIFLMNLITGWTGIGWLLTLAWAMSAERKPQPRIIVVRQEKEREEICENIIWH